MKRQMILLALMSLALLATLGLTSLPRVHAQTGDSYDLTWSTIDSGGGAVTGGGYTLNSTLGQPDVGVASGGSYTLVGGFWSSAAMQYRVYLPMVLRH